MLANINIAFIGLGVMGFPMAGHLATAGVSTTVYNRTTAKAAQWCQTYNGTWASSPADAAKGADIVLVCVGNDSDLHDVTLGADGALHGMSAGSILIDHTTASADMARTLHQHCSTRGIGFVDAPVSGGQQGAEQGQLSIMCGGDATDFNRAKPLLELYAKAVQHMGPAGHGQLTKMVNQICIAGLLEGLAEGMHFAQQAGLDTAKVIDVIQHGAAGSWQMVNRHQTMLADHYDHGFAVDWMRKDLMMCLEEGRKNGSYLPVTTVVNDYYKDVQHMGGGRWDTSSLLKRLQSLPPQNKPS